MQTAQQRPQRHEAAPEEWETWQTRKDGSEHPHLWGTHLAVDSHLWDVLLHFDCYSREQLTEKSSFFQRPSPDENPPEADESTPSVKPVVTTFTHSRIFVWQALCPALGVQQGPGHSPVLKEPHFIAGHSTWEIGRTPDSVLECVQSWWGSRKEHRERVSRGCSW